MLASLMYIILDYDMMMRGFIQVDHHSLIQLISTHCYVTTNPCLARIDNTPPVKLLVFLARQALTITRHDACEKCGLIRDGG